MKTTILCLVGALALINTGAMADMIEICRAEAESGTESELPTNRADFLKFCDCMEEKAAANPALNEEYMTKLVGLGNEERKAARSPEFAEANNACMSWEF